MTKNIVTTALKPFRFMNNIVLKGSCLMMLSISAFADDNPFGMTTVTADELQGKINEGMSKSTKQILIGVGIMLLVSAVISYISMADSDVGENGKSGTQAKTGGKLVQILITAALVIVGITMIAVGWKAASYTPS